MEGERESRTNYLEWQNALTCPLHHLPFVSYNNLGRGMYVNKQEARNPAKAREHAVEVVVMHCILLWCECCIDVVVDAKYMTT